MAIALRRLLDVARLGLHVVNVGDQSRPVEWAHVSELTDVAQWLSGGELLLTTGLQLRDDAELCERYCRHLWDAGVAAVGVSVGPGLTWQEMPGHLVAAARRTGLPLIEVPYATPMEAIVREVASILELENTERLRRAIRAQQALTASSLRPGGLRGILAALVAAAGGWAVVCDRWAGVLEATVPDAEKLVADLGITGAAASPGGPDAAAYIDDDSHHLVLPIVSGRVTRGLLVVGGRDRYDSYDRILFASAVSLLTLELEYRHRSEQAVWRQGQELLEWLARGTGRRDEVQVRLLRFGVQASTATAFVVDPRGQDTSLLREVLSQEIVPHLRSLLLSERKGVVRALVLDAPDDVSERIARVTSGMHVGMGRPVDVWAAALSLRQAGRALEVARLRRLHMVDVDHLRGFRAVRDLADPAMLSAVADAILAPLDAYDLQQPEPVLVPTVREFLNGAGTAEATADALGIHRHTVRQRLERVRELSGLDLRDGEDRFELLLATRVRDLLDQ